jgi:elongator complex protein 1
MPGKIQHIIPSSDSRTAYVVVNNQIYRYNDRDGLLKSDTTISNEKFSRAVVKMESVNFGEKEVIITLTRNHVLYANGNQIINNVTSFFVHSESLLITTQQHTLICFELSSNGLDQLFTKDLTVQPWENKSNVQGVTIM